MPNSERRALKALAPLLALTLSLLACPGREVRKRGAALWVAEESGAVSTEQLTRLQQGGIGELFVEAATLDWEQQTPHLTRRVIPALPLATPATLVLRGSLPPPGVDAGRAARTIGLELEQIYHETQRSLSVSGVHLDLSGLPAPKVGLSTYADLLDGLRGQLGRTARLSATVERSWLTNPDIEEVLDPVDFVVAFLYGQRAGEEEDVDAWDFRQVEAGLRRLDELDRDYLLGIVTLGAAAVRGRAGQLLGFLTRLSLADLVRDDPLTLDKEFSFDSVDRQIYNFSAQEDLELGGKVIKAGQALRIVSTATPHVEDLLELIKGWELRRCLGELYYRAPGEAEELSMTLDNVLNAIAPGRAEPKLELDVTLRRRRRGRWWLRVKLHNPTRERTDLATLDYNYVELQLEAGAVGTVKPGGFWRFDEFRVAEDGTTERRYRGSNVLRLFQPLLEAGQTVSSGDIEIIFRGRDPGLNVSAKFMLPDSRQVVVERRRFSP